MGARKHVLVAGAGLGGLTAALSLLDRGFDVDVFEQAPDLGEVGAGVQIGPSGLRVLFALGLQAEIEAVWFLPVGRQMRVWNTGYTGHSSGQTSYFIERFGFANVAMHRADLHDILVRAVRARKPDAIHVNARVERFEESEGGVTIHLADGARHSGDMLVGADGLHSKIRRQLFGESKAHFTGCIAWRGAIPIDRLPEDSRMLHTQNWMGVNGHFVCYPIRRGELINIVGHIERDDWRVESWTEKGTYEEIANDFRGWHEHIQTLIRNIDVPYKWAMFLHHPLKQWSVGHVTLLGDACHSTLPYLASGAVMAIEDGYMLARCLERYPDIREALKKYEEARIPRTTRIVEASAANQHSFHHAELGDPETARAYIDRESAKQLNIRDWLFGYDATTVPV